MSGEALLLRCHGDGNKRGVDALARGGLVRDREPLIGGAMDGSSERWSRQRRALAQRVAAVLYGVVAIMTAEIGVQASAFAYAEAAFGALLVGVAMTVTRFFIELVKKETEIGAHLPISKAGAIICDSLLVMLFPAMTALLIVVAGLTTSQWTMMLDVLLYFGMATVFVIGFLSSYVLDGEVRPAALRGAAWMLLSIVLAAAKTLA
jgi:hypothetical protein